MIQANNSSLYKLWVRDWTQVWIISIICFCLPGMYNALSGVGGGGQVVSTVSANASVALASVGTVFSLFIAPAVFDLIGARWCILLGGFSYPLYCGAQLCFGHTQNAAFVIAAGAILGAGAAFLWIPQGSIMTSLVPRNQLGRAIGLFWVVFNLGGSVGGFLSMGLNWKSKAAKLNDSTFYAFIAIQIFGWLCAVFVCRPEQVLRADGSHPPIAHLPSKKGAFMTEMKSLFLMVLDYRVLCVIPMFFSANFFYLYQQNSFNAAGFTIRGRGLNSAIYWVAQMFGGLFIGFMLDTPSLKIASRARVAWGFIFCLAWIVWGCGYKWQLWFNSQGEKQWIDVAGDRTYMAGFWLYFFYGFMDAVWQSYSYWVMGQLSSNSNTAARFVGLYKCMVSVGAACASRINALGYSSLTQLYINWGLIVGSLLLALPTILAISDTSELRQPFEIEVDGDHDTVAEVGGDEELQAEKKHVAV